MTVVTSAYARDLMGLGMDARTLNMEQDRKLSEQLRTLLNDTPEIDSVVDHIQVLLREGVDVNLVAPLLTLTTQLVQSTQETIGINAAEGDLEMQLTGALDEIASKMHHLERNGQMQNQFTVKALGEKLRWALPIVCEPQGRRAVDVVNAGAVVDRVLAHVPAAELFTESVRNQLREANWQRLIRVHAERTAELVAA